jgi:hypothetical protein
MLLLLLLQELYLGYDVWSVMGLQLPACLPVLRRLRISSAIQDLTPLANFTSLQVGCEVQGSVWCLRQTCWWLQRGTAD